MRFENGRFAGSSDSTFLFIVVRFDERSSIISGEIYDGVNAPSDLRRDPIAKALFEFVANFTSVNPVVSRTKNTAEVSSDGAGITITSSKYVLSFSKGQNSDALSFKYIDANQVEFAGEVERTDEFRRIEIDLNQEPGATVIASARHKKKQCLSRAVYSKRGFGLRPQRGNSRQLIRLGQNLS